MRSWFSQQNSIWLGCLSVWIFIALFAAFFFVGVLAGIRQIELPMHYIMPIQTILYCVPFIFFLLGVRGFAVRRSDSDLIRATNTLLVINVLEMVILYPFSFPLIFDEQFSNLLLIAAVPVLCVNGIALLRLAEAFNRYIPELGGTVKRLVWWNKVGGWMLASVVLILPGLLAALIGEFFLWRLLAQESKRTNVPSATTSAAVV